MARAVLLMGGNIGDMKTRLQTAQQLLNANVGAVMHCSHRYKSPAWGFDSDGEFTNQAVEISTDLSPEALLRELMRLEEQLGRDRAAEAAEKARTGHRYTSRPIDIDIMFYDDEVIRSAELEIPHPLMGEREFALQPLCEIMRTRRHPVTGLTLGEMLDQLKQKENR